MRRNAILTTALVAGIIILVALNSTVFFFRVDITQNKIYTFSPATKRVFQTIPQTVTITYWVSDRLKKISPIPGEIENILSEYASASQGKVAVRFINPGTAGATTDPKSLGVYPEQMNIVAQSAQTTAVVYSGIVVQYLDRHATIPFIATTKDIEYALTAKIEEVLHPQNWNVAVLIGNSDRTLSSDYTLVGDGLGRYYHLQEVKPGGRIDPSARVLIVLGGADLTPADLTPINRYLMNGGNILFCVPGVKIDTRKSLNASLYGNLPIFGLINHYGVEIDPELVLDTHNKDFRTLRQSGGQYVWQDYGPYPHWISVLPSDVSKSNPITRYFTSLDLLWPSPLTELNLAGIKYTALVKSSSSAWTMSSHFDTSPVDIPAFSKPADPSLTGQFNLAVAMTGRFPDYYSTRKSPETRMIVVGNDDFLSNLVHYSGSLYNVSFLEDAVDWLAGNDGLLAIKTKGQWNPQLDKIADPNAKLRVYRFAQFVNIALIPLIVILFGLRRYSVRRRSSKQAAERSS